MARFIIAAAHKSSGKTTVSIGLTALIRRRGLVVQPFKKGPDYIDPMWLGRAARRSCYNLDFNTMTSGEILSLWQRKRAPTRGHPKAEVSIVEANKGLFDGVDLEGSDSNAALAKLLGLPVVLVIDTSGMTRGIAPLLQGYQGFDPDITIMGVILNNVGGPRHEGKLRAAVERFTELPVLGAIARNRALSIAERHLGLTPPGEISLLDEQIGVIADAVAAGVDVAALQALAQIRSADLRQGAGSQEVPFGATEAVAQDVAGARPVRIAVARDAAFGFYYPDDFEALEAAGAQLVPFNAMTDPQLPDADGLFIGGGFPETHMQELAANLSLRLDIKRAIEAGLPTYAECGGLMYLCRRLKWQDASADMVGVIPGDAVMNLRPQGRGYARLRERSAMPWPDLTGGAQGAGQEFAAHEFHYASVENLQPTVEFAYDVKRGHGIDGRRDGIVMHNLLASFAHLRDTDANHWCARFVAFVRARSGG